MNIRRFEGKLEAAGMRVGIVLARFNNFFTDKLLEGAVDCLIRHGADEKLITAAYVPGSFEIPYAAGKMAKSGDYDVVICLGVLIRGDTPHFEYIAAEASKGVARLTWDTGVPVIYGLVTADTIEQAIERSGTKAGNKGWQAAEAAIEMVNLYKVIA
jgi:6,7-dimethyl-8-ribityllumazine synthase